MTGRSASRWILVAAVLAGIAAWWLLRRPAPDGAPVASPVPRVVPAESGKRPAAPAPAEPAIEGESRLADALNAPGGTIQRDLEIVNELFATWQTNFPKEGNPVGENAEITAALAGANPLRFAFLPRRHPAINPAGELCDRWGTPFRFHQISGRQMEIRSAGPDRKFGTPDDALWKVE